MNERLPLPLRAAYVQAQARWAKFAPRERRLVSAAAALVGIGLVWGLFVQPAWRTLRDAPAQLAAVDEQLQQMQRLASESQALRNTPQVSAAQAETALRAATARLGPAARLNLQGERATVTLTGVSGETLAGWLSEVRGAARARPVEAQLSRGAAGYSGTLVLTLGRAG